MSLQSNTHRQASRQWVGEVVEISSGHAVARLETRPEMAVDEQGLVHGSFAFGLADYAAMLAVNDPNVVLGAAETRFFAPVKCGETMLASASVLETKGKKHIVSCSVTTDQVVFEGTFTCFVLERHVLAG